MTCPLCKRSAREGLQRQRHRRRRQRARAAAAAAAAQSASRDEAAGPTPAASASTAVPPAAAERGWWRRGLPSSLSGIFARVWDGAGAGRGWQQIGDGGVGGEGEDDDYDGGHRASDGRDSPTPEDGDESRRSTSVFNAYQAAVFGGAEPSPHISSAGLSGGGASGGDGDGDGDESIVGAALQTFFGGRGGGGGGWREGERRRFRGGAAGAEYELAPVGPVVAEAAAAAVRANVQNVDVV